MKTRNMLLTILSTSISLLMAAPENSTLKTLTTSSEQSKENNLAGIDKKLTEGSEMSFMNDTFKEDPSENYFLKKIKKTQTMPKSSEENDLARIDKKLDKGDHIPFMIDTLNENLEKNSFLTNTKPKAKIDKEPTTMSDDEIDQEIEGLNLDNEWGALSPSRQIRLHNLNAEKNIQLMYKIKQMKDEQLDETIQNLEFENAWGNLTPLQENYLNLLQQEKKLRTVVNENSFLTTSLSANPKKMDNDAINQEIKKLKLDKNLGTLSTANEIRLKLLLHEQSFREKPFSDLKFKAKRPAPIETSNIVNSAYEEYAAERFATRGK